MLAVPREPGRIGTKRGPQPGAGTGAAAAAAPAAARQSSPRDADAPRTARPGRPPAPRDRPEGRESRRRESQDRRSHWGIVYVGNVIGCLGTAALAVAGNLAGLGNGGFGRAALQIAASKSALPVGEALARGVLCNALVCLAVWLAMGGRSVADKIPARAVHEAPRLAEPAGRPRRWDPCVA
ncbi:MAG: formate/nitrite transporter family protein [Planctomycetes bacterium]|nr:formate/nitrite transporter family protein [Planctomycetota bacterium]